MIKPLVSGLVIGMGLAFSFVVFLLKNPDKLEKLLVLVHRAGSWFWEHSRRKHLALEIQSRVNGECEELDAETGGALPHAMRIEWVSDVDLSSFLRDDQVIVRMNRDPHDDANLVRATLSYLNTGLLPRSRPYLSESLRKATDFVVAARLLGRQSSSSARSYFYENVWGPTIAETPAIGAFAETLENIDGEGLLTRLYLRELAAMADAVMMRSPSLFISDEIEEFLSFLDGLATKEPGEDAQLTFLARSIRVSVILVAKPTIVQQWGTAAHENRVGQVLSQGARGVYLKAIRDANVSLALSVARRAQKMGLLAISRVMHYSVPSLTGGKPNTAVIIACQPTAQQQAYRQPRRDETLVRQSEEVFSELAAHELRIVAATREERAIAKIALAAGDSGLDVGLWIQQVFQTERFDTLRKAIDVEYLNFVEWYDDPCAYAIAALCPLDPNAVLEIWEESDSGEVWLDVLGNEEVGKAVGRGGVNIRAANKLIGRRIMVFGSTQSEGSQAVVAALQSHIPEIARGQIEIKGIGFIPRLSCRVVVASDTLPNVTYRCAGDKGVRAKAVRAAIDTPINFVKWQDAAAQMAVNALHPLKREDVVEATEGEQDGEVTIIVRRRASAYMGMVLGTHRCHLQTAARAIGRRIHLFWEDGEPVLHSDQQEPDDSLEPLQE